MDLKFLFGGAVLKTWVFDIKECMTFTRNQSKSRLRYAPSLAAFGAFAVLACAPALRAGVIWNWSYSSDVYTGSGTFTTESTTSTQDGFTGYLITSMSG